MIHKPCIKKNWLFLSFKHCHQIYGRCLFYKQYSIRKIFFTNFHKIYIVLLQNTQFKSQSCHGNLNCILGLLEEGKEYIIIMAVWTDVSRKEAHSTTLTQSSIIYILYIWHAVVKQQFSSFRAFAAEHARMHTHKHTLNLALLISHCILFLYND